MNKTTKITLEELIRRKEQMLESKKRPKTETLYIKSLADKLFYKASYEVYMEDEYEKYKALTGGE